MLCTDLVIRTDNTALKKAPDTFYAVVVNITPDPLFGMMINRLVRRVFIGNPEICGILVGHQSLSVWLGVTLDESMEHLAVGLLPMLALQTDCAATLYRSEYHGL